MTFEELLAFARVSAPGKFYLVHLRKYPWVHWLARRAWNVMVWCYFMQMRLHRTPKIFIRLSDMLNAPRPDPLTRMEAIPTYRSDIITLAAREVIVTPPPLAFPEGARKGLVSPHAQYEFPTITAITLKDAIAHGGSNFVTTDKAVLHHDLYDFTSDLTVEEMHGRCAIDTRKHTIRWFKDDISMGSLAIAADFIDGCAVNYAHWLTEVLPRLAMFCAHAPFQDIPILLNDGLHPNLMESVKRVTGDRTTIQVPVGHCLHAHKLIVISPTGYVPFHRRKTKIKNPSQGVFSGKALSALRQTLTASLPPTPQAARKIYIRRNSTARTITNHKALEALVLEQGFTIIEPEKLSFSEQVVIFNQAEVVVGQGGAALANLIFCKPGTRIIIMSIDSPDASHWYWQNMACATGNTTTFVLGPPRDLTHLHTDFLIDPEALLAALSA